MKKNPSRSTKKYWGKRRKEEEESGGLLGLRRVRHIRRISENMSWPSGYFGQLLLKSFAAPVSVPINPCVNMSAHSPLKGELESRCQRSTAMEDLSGRSENNRRAERRRRKPTPPNAKSGRFPTLRLPFGKVQGDEGWKGFPQGFFLGPNCQVKVYELVKKFLRSRNMPHVSEIKMNNMALFVVEKVLISPTVSVSS